ncbi:MAG: alpha/beta hydrolase [Acidimicrobiia bacterium]|nr:alpha/beta hydrolase [Acidimicrobiia bacterium]
MEPFSAVRVGEVDLAVYEEGAGEPVVLIHGFPELAYSWRHQVPALAAAGYRAIAYDLRGFGGSSRPEPVEAYRLTELVGDLVGLLDALQLQRATVVGHDWGSIVAWSAAVMAPPRVEALVSLNVPYRGWCCGFPTTATIASRHMDRFGYVVRFQGTETEERFAADPERWLRRAYAGVAAKEPFMTDAEFAVYRGTFEAGGITAPLNLYRNIDRNVADTTAYADAPVTVPTMMIAADADPVLPAALSEGMERWIPDLRTEVITNCGHWTQQERPAEVNRLLIDFLEGRSANRVES